MGQIVRMFAPLVLFGLAFLVWFEAWLPGHDWIARELGETVFLRIVVGALCVYVAILIAERRVLADQFRQVLGQFKAFHELRQAESGDPEGREAAKVQAVQIMAGTLESADETARSAAHENLVRLVGEDLGREPGPWREWAARQPGA